jgi:DNA-binding NarL/FixJ family response regulator
MAMDSNVRIVLAEDHIIVRDGVKALISAYPQFEIVGEVETGLEAIRIVDELKPDLILMDLTMPRMNGMEAISEIKSCSPETKVLILTVHKIEEYVRASLQAGADGYLLKKSSQEELINAIRHVISGEPYLDPGISSKIITGYLTGKSTGVNESRWSMLTKREREVLKLIAEGYKNSEIAQHLCISVHTVETHRDNLMKKLDLHNTAALTAFAINRGLVSR